jgi:hypothetical protein
LHKTKFCAAQYLQGADLTKNTITFAAHNFTVIYSGAGRQRLGVGVQSSFHNKGRLKIIQLFLLSFGLLTV